MFTQPPLAANTTGIARAVVSMVPLYLASFAWAMKPGVRLNGAAFTSTPLEAREALGPVGDIVTYRSEVSECLTFFFSIAALIFALAVG